MIVRLHQTLAAAALALVLAPAATAAGYQPPDVRDAAEQAQLDRRGFSPPDIRDAAEQAGLAARGFSPPDVRDASESPRPVASPVAPTIVVGPGGFDWGDAGIGAAAALGLAAAAAGAVAVGTHRRGGGIHSLEGKGA
jgi:hypothetical protein